MKNSKPSSFLSALILSGAIVSVVGCGGGGGDGTANAIAADTATSAPSNDSGSSSPSSSSPSSNTSAPAAPDAPQAPPTAQPALPLPTAVANGSTLELECGRTYHGTLDLRGKSNISIRTAGGCGQAVISPAQEIGGWTQHQGNIFSAPVDFAATQVIVDGQPQRLAHWPSRSQTWAKADASTASSLRYALPDGDLTGATLVFKPYDWAIEARNITGYSGGTMTLAVTGNPDYDGYGLSGRPDFYVEGKLWMLDEPGEWVVSGGRLYLWAPEGKSPEGRVWAAADRHGIDAARSSGITVDNVTVFGAANGINAPDASGLRLTNTNIVNSSRNGIYNSGGSGLAMDGGSIRNTRHDAIAVKWGGGGEVIRNVRINASGAVGMPVNAHAAINLTAGSGASVTGNTVTNSGYIGIRTFRNATVTDNVVDGACLTLTDCGGIFTSAPDGQPLNTRIERNTVRKVGIGQRLAWGIYLSDSANKVTVANNTIADNANGMEIFDSRDNTVTANTFSTSRQAHIQMAETVGGRVRGNTVTGNVFLSRDNEETYRISSDAGVSSVQQFATYDGNQYTSSSAIFANFNGEALNYAQWKIRSSQDGGSSFNSQ